MKDRRRPAPHISHERWLVSYADFVTLLFAFFVVLYASAQIDKQKAAQLSDAIEAAFQQLGVFRGRISRAWRRDRENGFAGRCQCRRRPGTKPLAIGKFEYGAAGGES